MDCPERSGSARRATRLCEALDSRTIGKRSELARVARALDGHPPCGIRRLRPLEGRGKCVRINQFRLSLVDSSDVQSEGEGFEKRWRTDNTRQTALTQDVVVPLFWPYKNEIARKMACKECPLSMRETLFLHFAGGRDRIMALWPRKPLRFFRRPVSCYASSAPDCALLGCAASCRPNKWRSERACRP